MLNFFNRQLTLAKIFGFSCALLGLVMLISLPVWNWLPAESWHDSQRAGQILIITLAISSGLMLRVFLWPVYFVERTGRHVISTISLLGLCSAILAHQPQWALAEWAIFWGSVGLGWVFVVTHHRLKDKDRSVDRVLLFSVFVVCALLSVQFLTTYFATIFHANGQVDLWLLFSGFDNVRFFGQFSTLTLPLLVMPLLSGRCLGRFRYLGIGLFFLWWMQAIASGTRGTWLGVTVAAIAMALSGQAGRRWVLMQIFGVTGGLAAYLYLIDWLPSLVGMDVVRTAGDRLNTSLSSRDVIWSQAVEMIIQKPILGFGPMHFADIANPVAAHPHQAWLQWASEWGIPSALLMTGVVSYALWIAFRRLAASAHKTDELSHLYLCLFASVFASLTQSMVDGVLVMPYTQLWLTIISGWLLAIHWQHQIPRQDGTEHNWSYFVVGISFMLAAVALCAILLRDYPASWVERRSQTEHFQPRFWVQGVIAK